MPDIKTRDVVSSTIKTIDRSALAGQRMKDAYVQAKDKAEHSVYSSESNSEAYAADRITDGVSTAAREAVHQVDVQLPLPVKLFIRWMCRGTVSFRAHRGNPPNGRRIPSPSSPHHNRHRAVHNLPLIHLHPFLFIRCRIAPEQRTSTMHSSPTGYLPMGL